MSNLWGSTSEDGGLAMDPWESPEVEQDDHDGHHEQDDLPFQIALEQLELLSKAVHSHFDVAHRPVELVHRRLNKRPTPSSRRALACAGARTR